MYKVLIYVYVFLMELSILYVYGFRVFGFKKSKIKTLVFGIALFTVYFVINQYVINSLITNTILNLLINFMILLYGFNITTQSAFFHDCMLTAIMGASELIGYTIITVVFKINTISFDDNMFLFAIEVILSKTIYAFAGMMVCNIISKKNKHVDYGKSWYLMISPFTTTFVIVLLFLISSRYQITGKILYSCMIASVLMFVSDIIVFWVYENMQEQTSKLFDYEMERQKEELDKNYYEVLDRQNENMHILIHDMKNHLGIIQGLSNDDEITEYISEICDDMGKYTIMGQTGNKTLDIIIGKYINLCEANEVKFKFNAYNENIKFMNDCDTSSLINNLLDNAFEAAKNAPQAFIDISIYNKDDRSCIINVINKSTTIPKEGKKNLISRKEDKERHGFGTKSIKKITDKYNGSYTWYFDDEKMVFHSTIMLPLSELNLQ